MSAEVYAEDVNYWLTERTLTSAERWMEHAKKEIKAANGKVVSEAFGSDETGRAAYMLEFSFGAERFRIVWPVLKSRSNNVRAARVQAATMLYHDIKAKCVSAKVHGPKAAFFQFLMLPDGRTAAQLAAPELSERYPKMLTSGE
jgi:hypothetical protein